jgi:hypothetical protein
MSKIRRNALCAAAAIALSLGAHGMALADPVGADDSNAVASSDSQCNGESLLCAGPSLSQILHDQTQPRHKVSVLHRARLHSVSRQQRAAAPAVVAYNWGSAGQSILSCKGENAWSLLCPGSEVIGINY